MKKCKCMTAKEELKLVERLLASEGLQLVVEDPESALIVDPNDPDNERGIGMEHPYYGTVDEWGLQSRAQSVRPSNRFLKEKFGDIVSRSLEEIEIILTAKGF